MQTIRNRENQIVLAMRVLGALTVLSLLLGVSTTSLAQVADEREIKPNILLVVVDDLGYGELGCQGNKQIPTPNIDSIAERGIRFTNAYVSAPVCSPSRAGFLTGRYQTRFGHEFNAIGPQNREKGVGLPLSQKTLAELLKSEGYVTGLIGKWHLGASNGYRALNRGFDEFYGFLHEGHSYVPPQHPGVISWFRVSSLPARSGTRLRKGNYVFSSHMGYTEPAYDENNPIQRGWEPVAEPQYLTDALAREAVAFIERHASRPFFLYVSFNAPHSPMQAPVKYIQKFESIPDIHRRIFAGMVAALDDAMGRLLETLRRHGLEKNTFIILFSDNGGPTKELTSSNAPLRGGKGDLYEGGIRIPFLLQWQAELPCGIVYDPPIISLDAVPTALAAAGAGERVPENLDGVNLLPYLTGNSDKAPHESLFWRYGPKIALRSGRWKLVHNPSRGRPSTFELYDLSTDISETTDLAAKRPEILKRLKKELESYNRQMVNPLWRSKGSARRKNWPLDLIE
ncbi:sulfatase [Acidobacteria bacterium AH-259-A15]|nr:sulfatase [Acidobacteria bacterium AH-259-A15]